MNALGTPNYISGVSLCAGNTAAVNKMTYGWFHFADIASSKCIVLFERQCTVDHDWVKLQTETGEVTAKVLVQVSMKQGHIRVPHGWWYPEMRGEAKLAGAFSSSDAVLCPDDQHCESDVQETSGFA